MATAAYSHLNLQAADLEHLIRDIARGVERELLLSDPVEPASNGSCAHESDESHSLRHEIVAVGRKLWQRSYVDGCGGNISVRLGSDLILCTPSMLSKGDLTPSDLCVTDMAGKLVEGSRPRTSELQLHIAIYSSTSAGAVVHCHPPHATAFAITECEPPGGYIVEKELFVGRIPIAPYETPGTTACAQAVLPFLPEHNTILLANHGIVCWADTATHAEWLVEIAETYCQTVLLAGQIKAPLRPIPAHRQAELEAVGERIRGQVLSNSTRDAGLQRVRRHASSKSPPVPGESEIERHVRSAVFRLMNISDLGESH